MVASVDKVFAGSIPELYERLMVPLIFEPYALDLARYWLLHRDAGKAQAARAPQGWTGFGGGDQGPGEF